MLYAVGFLCLAVFGGAIFKARFALDLVNNLIEEGEILKLFSTFVVIAIVAAGAGQIVMLQGVLSSLYLMIHEGGHFIFCSLLPIGSKIACSAGGSFIECFFPFIFFILFAYRRSFWISSLFLSLLSFGIFSTSRYVSDAAKRELPLIASPEAFLSGDTNISDHHDWYTVFSSFEVLEYSSAFGIGLYYLGWVVGVVGIIFPWIISLREKASARH